MNIRVEEDHRNSRRPFKIVTDEGDRLSERVLEMTREAAEQLISALIRAGFGGETEVDGAWKPSIEMKNGGYLRLWLRNEKRTEYRLIDDRGANRLVADLHELGFGVPVEPEPQCAPDASPVWKKVALAGERLSAAQREFNDALNEASDIVVQEIMRSGK